MNNQCDRCKKLDDTIRLGIKNIPELSSKLKQESVDGMTWTSIYSCEDCGIKWKEEYESSGHGEVPVT